ncbi:MAG: DoxX family membrane protein [Deltaproteobacteria bacterium]|nr:DoxX family membrane protein [Deltaproteobacteria bacterium]
MSDLARRPGARLLGPYLAWLFCVALGVVFIVAGVPKIIDPLGFAHSIANYHLVPDTLINAMAITLPWIEVCCGLGLILGLSVRANLLVVEAMLMVFIGAILSAMSRELDISCGCFTAASADTAHMTRATLYWDIIWLVMGLHALIFYKPMLSVRSWFGRSWFGRSWFGRSWFGRSWFGRSWFGRSWFGRSRFGPKKTSA